jgi:class 3 adenylate cyclase
MPSVSRSVAGLHTGEIELLADDIGGIGVHVASRVLDHARPGELLVSSAVPPLVVGSRIDFEDRGEHELKGVPGTWRLLAVDA